MRRRPADRPIGRGARVAAGVAAALLTGLTALPASAQQVLVEVRAGAAVGRYTETGAGLELLPRPSFGATVQVRALETLSGYATFTRSSFGCEESLCTDRDVALTSQGLLVGGRWEPVPSWSVRPWVRAGVGVLTLDVDAEGGSETTDPGPGFEAGAGLEFQVGERFRIRPGLFYLRHTTSTDAGDGHAAVMAFHVGLAVPVF